MTDKVYPGTLGLLVGRLAAKSDADARDYHSDIETILEWLAAVAEKEHGLVDFGYGLADRQSGGGAW